MRKSRASGQAGKLGCASSKGASSRPRRTARPSILVGNLIAWFEEGVGTEEQFDADRFIVRRVECGALVLEFRVSVSPCRRPQALEVASGRPT